MRAVDGDELTGTCYVGNQSSAALLGFVIIPTIVYLVVGLLCLICGGMAVVSASQSATHTSLRVRHGSHHSNNSSATSIGNSNNGGNFTNGNNGGNFNTVGSATSGIASTVGSMAMSGSLHRQAYTASMAGGNGSSAIGSHHVSTASRVLTATGCCGGNASAASATAAKDQLNVRVLIFAAFYLLPTCSILGSNMYEYLSRESWLLAGATERPNVEVFIFKIFMSLIVGMKSGLWMWSTQRSPFQLWSLLSARFKKPARVPAYVVATAPRAQKQPFLNSSTLDKQSLSRNGSLAIGPHSMSIPYTSNLIVPLPLVPAVPPPPPPSSISTTTPSGRHVSGGCRSTGGETSV